MIAQAWRVKNDVQIAFIHTVADAERVKLQQEMFKMTKDRWLTVQEMFNMGQANQAALRGANIALALQRTRVLAAQNNLAYAWHKN